MMHSFFNFDGANSSSFSSAVCTFGVTTKKSLPRPMALKDAFEVSALRCGLWSLSVSAQGVG